MGSPNSADSVRWPDTPCIRYAAGPSSRLIVASPASTSVAYSSGWPSRDQTECTEPSAPLPKWNSNEIASSIEDSSRGAARRTVPTATCTDSISPAIAR